MLFTGGGTREHPAGPGSLSGGDIIITIITITITITIIIIYCDV